jgi:hypothetical protein
MFGRLKAMKDNALAMALKAFISERFSQYGELLDCEVDTREAQVRVRALLKGETQPIEVCIERYVLDKQGGERQITIQSLSCSREWIGLLLNRLFVNKPYRLPAGVASLL